MQSCLANTYAKLGRPEALLMKRDVYTGRLKLDGEEHIETFRAAYNYVVTLLDLQRFGKAKALLRKTTPVARRVLGQNHELVLEMRWSYGVALYDDDGATLDDLREAVMTLEELKRTARRVLGGAHPLTEGIEDELQDARAALRARDPPPRGA